MFCSFTGLLLSSVGSAADRTSAMKFTYIISSSLCAVQRESKWTSHEETWARKGGTDRRQRAKSPKEKPFNKLNYYNIKKSTSHDEKAANENIFYAWNSGHVGANDGCTFFSWISWKFDDQKTAVKCRAATKSLMYAVLRHLHFYENQLSITWVQLTQADLPIWSLNSSISLRINPLYVNAVGRSEFDFTPTILHSIFSYSGAKHSRNKVNENSINHSRTSLSSRPHSHRAQQIFDVLSLLQTIKKLWFMLFGARFW